MSAFKHLRTLVVLGRVSNLPTVWSNCLAGWWLGGAGHESNLPWLFAGTSFAYIGGMFLNDAFDVDFDRQYRTERPIPSGALSLRAVWVWGLGWLGLGGLCLIRVGLVSGILGLSLISAIIFYDFTHKHTPVAPWLMATCRFLVYVIAASAGINGVTGVAVWCGLALALYIAGLSYFARVESTQGPLRYAPVWLLAAPIVLALLLNAGAHRKDALLGCAVLALWTARSLRQTLWSITPHVGRTVSGLLAGIVFVDWLAVSPDDLPRELNVTFLALFGLALLFQKAVPAT